MTKSWKKAMAVGAAALMLSGFTSIADNNQAEAKVQWGKTVALEAHRGGRDARPEDTLASMAYAMELGVDVLEMDMQLTKDGKLVISHNPFAAPWLAKTPDGKYVQKEFQYDFRTMTMDQIKQFDVGTMNPSFPGWEGYYEGHGKTQIPVPGLKLGTLDEVFELANAYGNTNVKFDIETKSYADPADPGFKNNPDPAVFAKAVVDVVKKYGMEDRVIIQSFDWRTLKEVKKIAPNITTSALVNEEPSWGWMEGCYLKIGDKKPSPWLAGININEKPYYGDYVKAAHAIGADVVSPYYGELSPNLVAEAHDLGMKVATWTVNSPSDMNMMIDMGVDSIITDKPWILRDVMIKRGLPVAEPTINVNSPFHTGTDINNVETKKAERGSDAAV